MESQCERVKIWAMRANTLSEQRLHELAQGGKSPPCCCRVGCTPWVPPDWAIVVVGDLACVGRIWSCMMADQGSNTERKGTRVTFLDQTGAKSVEAVIADTVTVRRILPNIITKMNLPVMGPDGQPMSYSLDHKEGGKRLRDDQTLPAATVVDGDHLIVYPEIVAG